MESHPPRHPPHLGQVRPPDHVKCLPKSRNSRDHERPPGLADKHIAEELATVLAALTDEQMANQSESSGGPISKSTDSHSQAIRIRCEKSERRHDQGHPKDEREQPQPEPDRMQPPTASGLPPSSTSTTARRSPSSWRWWATSYTRHLWQLPLQALWIQLAKELILLPAMPSNLMRMLWNSPVRRPKRG